MDEVELKEEEKRRRSRSVCGILEGKCGCKVRGASPLLSHSSGVKKTGLEDGEGRGGDDFGGKVLERRWSNERLGVRVGGRATCDAL